MNRRDFIKTSLGAAVCSMAVASGESAGRRPSILWVTMDDARADTLGCYGRHWAKTPHMDALAAAGVRFETAIVQNPVCVPSRGSMKSGHYPHTFNAMEMGKPRFEREQLRVYAGGLDLTPEQIGVARGTYYGMVSLVDDQVGRLVDCLRKAGLLDSTIVAINSDQGWQLGEHGLWKKRVLYDDNVKAPLVLSCPALLPKGKVIDEPVEMIDFVPTLMDLSGLAVPDSIPGRSLTPLIRGEVTQWREACFCEIDHSLSMYDELRQRSGRRVMVRTKEWKLIWFMDERVADRDGALYNLKDDPGERVNLYGRPEHADVVEYLERLGREWDRAT